MGQDLGGSIRFKAVLSKWNGQLLLQLAYFDRLCHFFKSIVCAVSSKVEVQVQGNTFFSADLPALQPKYAVALSRYLECVDKARKVATHFRINPVWTLESFDTKAQEYVEELYGIFFKGKWKEETPNIELATWFKKESFNFDVLERSMEPGFVRIVAQYIYLLLGEKVDAGSLSREYSAMAVRQKNVDGERIEIALIGTETTSMIVQRMEPTKESGTLDIQNPQRLPPKF